MLGALQNLFSKKHGTLGSVPAVASDHGMEGLPTTSGNLDTGNTFDSNSKSRQEIVNTEDDCAGPDDTLHGLLNAPEEFAAEQKEFLRQYGADYGYGGQLSRIREQEFRRLRGHVYLDYAGAALYSERQIQACADDLMSQLLCNPHSSSSSLTSPSSEALAALRRETLDLLRADGRQYEVVLTSGATAGLRMVAECFPWTPGCSLLAHPPAVHNSVLGMRGPALAAGAAVQLVQLGREAGGGLDRAMAAAAGEVVEAKAVMAEAEAEAVEGSVKSVGATAAAAMVTLPYGQTPNRVVAIGSPYNVASSAASGCGSRGSSTYCSATAASVGRSDGSGGSSTKGVVNSGGGDGEGGEPPPPPPPCPAPPAPCYHLLALPVECNFTGDRYELGDVVRHVQQYGIDSATGAAMPYTAVPAAASSVPAGAVGCSGDEDDANADAVSDGCAATQDIGSRGGGGGGCRTNGRWLVLLDAAKACATAPPDLSTTPADIVVLSYYKIFGHPTGLGALVVRRDVLDLLVRHKSYFGGGTVEVAVADRPYQVLRPGPAGLEDGTPAFTAAAAARHGFSLLRRLGGPPAVHRHATCLTRWLAARLAALRHGNGAPVCVLYGKWCNALAASAPPPHERHVVDDVVVVGGSLQHHGPTLCFNLLRPTGQLVGCSEVGRLAALHGLLLRTGCFCNPGACGEWLGLSGEQAIENHRAGHVCWDERDFLWGAPTGAVRVSLGAVSSFRDAWALLALVRRSGRRGRPAPVRSSGSSLSSWAVKRPKRCQQVQHQRGQQGCQQGVLPEVWYPAAPAPLAAVQPLLPPAPAAAPPPPAPTTTAPPAPAAAPPPPAPPPTTTAPPAPAAAAAPPAPPPTTTAPPAPAAAAAPPPPPPTTTAPPAPAAAAAPPAPPPTTTAPPAPAAAAPPPAPPTTTTAPPAPAAAAPPPAPPPTTTAPPAPAAAAPPPAPPTTTTAPPAPAAAAPPPAPPPTTTAPPAP
ncbi:hypothetical protein Agub_g2672, partial [Astrephomene gubernaculifera]